LAIKVAKKLEHFNGSGLANFIMATRANDDEDCAGQDFI